jgi:hypothetical protein
MRKHLMITMALAALVAVSMAAVAWAGGKANNKPVVGRAGNLEFEFGGGFSPKALSKTKQTPITLTASGKLRNTEGGSPPPLTEVIVDTDKNGQVNVKGFPTCKGSQLQATDTKAAEKACKSAIIGSGQTSVDVTFPEQAPIPAHSKLLVFNGGQKGGTTTLYIHAYLTQPITTAIVTTLKITKEHKGRYGTHTVAKIPPIANYAGAVTSFNLKIGKTYTYKGKKMSILSAKCPDGKLEAHATAKFHNGSTVSAEFIRPCTPKK